MNPTQKESIDSDLWIMRYEFAKFIAFSVKYAKIETCVTSGRSWLGDTPSLSDLISALGSKSCGL
jgi:hypothetical protein